MNADLALIRPILAEISVSKIKFHTLRACFATQLLSDGVEMSKLMKIGGMERYKNSSGLFALNVGNVIVTFFCYDHFFNRMCMILGTYGETLSLKVNF